MPQIEQSLHKPDVYVFDTFEAAVRKRAELIAVHSEWDSRFQPRQLIIARDFQDKYIIARTV